MTDSDRRKLVIGADPDPSRWTGRPEESPHLEDPEVRRLLTRSRREGVYVSEGMFVCRRLAMNSQYREIPEYCSAITALTVSPDGVVYGATSGDQSYLFLYDPQPPFDAVLVLGELPGETAVSGALVWEKPGSIICGGNAGPETPEGWPGGSLQRVSCRGYRVDAVQEWPCFKGKFESLGIPVPGEGIAALVMGAESKVVYGLSETTGTLFAVNLETTETRLLGTVDPTRYHSRQLIAMPDGSLMAAAVGGYLVRYDPQIDRLESLEARLPRYPGRGFYARVDAWIYEPQSGLLYLGDQADGFLYSMDPSTLECRIIGKPSDRRRIRALVAAPDGRVFGMTGDAGDIGQFFVYEPATRTLRNLGLPLAAIEERRYAFEFTSAVSDHQGRLYFGESERQSRLFCYFPGVAPLG